MNREELLKTAKPILFNTDMVRAILESRKVVTRRLLKPQLKTIYYDGKVYDDDGLYVIAENQNGGVEQIELPYRPNDILYVRETWAKGYDGEYIYRADDKLADLPKFKDSTKIIYRPSIHMPKEAARIFLRVMDVRVERLQNIDDDGVVAEGLKIGAPFDELWNSTIKPADRAIYGWDANPWVWVIEFEKVEVSDNA